MDPTFFYSGSKVATSDPTFLPRIQSFDFGSNVFHSGCNVSAADTKLVVEHPRGAPWVRKYENPSMREILVGVLLSVRTSVRMQHQRVKEQDRERKEIKLQ